VVHDDVRDKAFELELSWVSKESNGVHQRVPPNVFAAAEQSAKAAVAADSESEDDM